MNKRNKAFPQESPIWNFYTLKKMTAFVPSSFLWLVGFWFAFNRWLSPRPVYSLS